MLVVVYDISNDRRRRCMHRDLSAVGRAVQYSAFECADGVMNEVIQAIERHVRRGDRVCVYRLCRRCADSAIIRGEALEEDVSATDVLYINTVVCGHDEPSADSLERDETVPPSFLMEHICSMDNLRSAWKRVKANRGCAGIDGVGLVRFETGLSERLAELQAQLISGAYRADRLKTFSIPKASGGTRRLSVPTVRDRVAQQAVLRVLGPILDEEFEDSSFGYRPGRSVAQAIRRIERLRDKGFTYVLDADIEDYFGTIDRKELLEVFGRHVSDEGVCGLVDQWMHAAEQAPYRQESQLKGVPQGGVLSPLLANLYLDAFDERIEALGYRLVRYADDFVILCRSREQAEQALVDVGAVLDDLLLELNASKTRITSFAEGLHFLGYLLIGGMSLRMQRAKLLKSGCVRMGARRR